jgi:hypothetical protein
MRVGFTIILNGLQHLEHGPFIENMTKAMDYWVIVEGVALPNGSTAWCKRLDEGYVSDTGGSVDGTSELLMELWENYPNVEYIAPDGPWNSKDHMVNAAIKHLNKIVKGYPCMLWQVDADEQWTPELMQEAENGLIQAGGTCGCFHCDYFVGRGIVSRGTWGEGNNPKNPISNAYRRLWLWNGSKFKTHEPPCLVGGNGKEVLLPQRFSHFGYYFDDDVMFKEKYYGYKDLHKKWRALQHADFPQPLSALLNDGWNKTETMLYRI